MNPGGHESQKNMAVDQRQYLGEAVGTRNICKTKERRKKNKTTDKDTNLPTQVHIAEFLQIHVITEAL